MRSNRDPFNRLHAIFNIKELIDMPDNCDTGDQKQYKSVGFGNDAGYMLIITHMYLLGTILGTIHGHYNPTVLCAKYTNSVNMIGVN